MNARGEIIRSLKRKSSVQSFVVVVIVVSIAVTALSCAKLDVIHDSAGDADATLFELADGSLDLAPDKGPQARMALR